MDVPLGNRARRKRLRRVQGVGPEAYFYGTSHGTTPEDTRKNDHMIRARCAPFSPASGFPVSRSQQMIHETSRLRLVLANVSPMSASGTNFF
jgi:hypothetical protein